jgi:Clp amino terminal domain, pathogenicity island component
MFERFTPQARRVIVYAADEARRLKNDHLGTEHILLGLLCVRGSVAASVLEAEGFSLEKVRELCVEINGFCETSVREYAPFTGRSKKVCEMAMREATQLGHNYIGTEHLLLGLITQYEGVGYRIIMQYKCDSHGIHKAVTERLKNFTGVRYLDGGLFYPSNLTFSANPKLTAVLVGLPAGQEYYTFDMLCQAFTTAVARTGIYTDRMRFAIPCDSRLASVLEPLAALKREANFKDLCAAIRAYQQSQSQ